MAGMAPEQRKRNTFTSYVAPTPGEVSAVVLDEEWCLSSDTRDVHLAKPQLLSSEQIVASAPAYLYPAIPMDTAIMELSGNTMNGTTVNNGPRERERIRETIFGLLSVTNFKLAFVPLHKQRPSTATSTTHYCSSQEHLHLQHNEITLNNIDYIVQVAESSRAASAIPGNAGRRKKRLDAAQKLMSGRIAALQVVCKNFRLLKFGFELTKGGRDWGKLIASALARFAFTNRHDLSFAYVYREPYYPTLVRGSMSMYASKNDWARELIRCGATNWQVISSESVPILQQQRHSSKYTFPPHFVIPKACTIERFLDLSRAFCDSRASFWVYGYGNASLVRLAELKPSAQQDTTVENVMLELVRGCNDRKILHLLQLTDRLPNIQDVQKSYLKLRRLCTPENVQQFLIDDSKFLTLLEKSNWLFYVSLCLRYACEAANTLKLGTTCVLQESNGRDLCCVISSLTQIILDPLYRTLDGFQSLIQKEWIALEHPFQRRLGHVRQSIDSNTPDEESPVFLLFLDCVWQLLQQYPDEFEFSQTYLTTLWDSCFMPLYDTFQFDCNADRLKASRDNNLILRPVWDWSEQFSDKDIIYFSNPLYHRHRQEMMPCRRSAAIPAGAIMLPGLAKPLVTASLIPNTQQQQQRQHQHHQQQQQRHNTLQPQAFIQQSSIPKDRYLEPIHHITNLALWEQCYYRWIPLLEIKGGGYPQIDFYQRFLQSNINKLQRALDLQDYDDLPDVYYELTHEQKPNTNSPTQSRSSGKGKGPKVALEPELIDGVERRHKILPPIMDTTDTVGSTSKLMAEISSFFPFSINTGTTPQLTDILNSSKEFLLEGSIVDRLSTV